MAFDLTDLLSGVSNPGTGREQIEYISLDLIDKDPNNFYLLSGIDDLAANIATCGLQQPIRLRAKADSPGRFVVVSGHRRREAVAMLAEEDPGRWKEIPCIVEQDDVSPALQQLRLIYANANTRKMTSAEIGMQAEQVEKLLYELKEQGYEFPGRMRDHVAQAVNASKSKLARLKVIRENLAGCWIAEYHAGNLNESVAYALAKMGTADQDLIYKARQSTGASVRWLYANAVDRLAETFSQIAALECSNGDDGDSCIHMDDKKICAAKRDYYATVHCGSCCASCPELVSCKNACPVLSDEIAALRAVRKESNRQAQQQRDEEDRPYIEATRALWDRFNEARQMAGLTVEDAYHAFGGRSAHTKQTMEDFAAGTAKIQRHTDPPYGSSFSIRNLSTAADVFGCSVDYLVCRTDDPTPISAALQRNVSNSDTWQQVEPLENGKYAVMARYCKGGRAVLTAMECLDGEWYEAGMEVSEMGIEVLCWTEIPEEYR